MTKIKKLPVLLLFSHIFIVANVYAADTKYPIVLIHGLYGFSDSLLCLGRYFGYIPDLLTEHGAQVYVAKVSQVHAFSVRGEQLYRQLVAWGHEKYNLIGHSMGGLDARYGLEKYPQIVSSVTTIGTPHRGSKLADYLEEMTVGNPYFGSLTLVMGNLLGYLVGVVSGEIHTQNAEKSLLSITSKALLQFNRDHPTGIHNVDNEKGSSLYNGIRLYSWGSYAINSIEHRDLFSKFLTKTTRVFDVDEPNDGLVALKSMKFGKWLGAYKQGHHLVPVGGVISSINDIELDWSSRMFIDHARRLKRKGL